MAGSEEKQAARVALNIIFREVVLCTQRNTEHAKEFNQSVRVESVEDYLAFVDPGDATVCIEQILSRTRSCFYTSISQFRGDFERILANAMAYNSPGHGRHAYKPIIDWAQDLLDVCCEEIESRHGDLVDAEKRLKDATEDSQTISQDESPRRESAMSSLETLIAACELAAEQDGLEDPSREDRPGQPDIPFNLMPPFMDMTFDESLGSWPFAGLPLMQLDAMTTKPAKHHQRGKLPSASAGRGNDSASRNRRHKSKVFIRPNKVVYLPTTFMEENFDAISLPVNCLMIVETNGVVQPEPHTVTIKAVPRQGLSTMYCMTNVMKFQQQFLNWQILDWTKVDSDHIKIHLQGPSSEGGPKVFDDSPKSAVTSSKRKGSSSGKAAMYDSAAAEDDEDGSAEREMAEDDDSNPEAPQVQSSHGSHSRAVAAKSARTSVDVRDRISPQNSDSSLPPLQGCSKQQQQLQSDPQLDLRSNEGRLSPSNSSGELSDPPIPQPAGGHASHTTAASPFVGMSHQQLQHPLLLAQSSFAMQLQQLQFQSAMAAAQQQQFSSNGSLCLGQRLPVWAVGNSGTVEDGIRQQQLLQQQLQMQPPPQLSFSSCSVPNLPMPDLQQQSHNAMLLLNQIMSGGNAASAYGTAPSSLRMPAQDQSGPEAASAFKKYKFGSQGAAVDTAVFSGAGSAPAAGLGLMPQMGQGAAAYGPIAVALLTSQQQMQQQQQSVIKHGFEGGLAPPQAHLQHSFSL